MTMSRSATYLFIASGKAPQRWNGWTAKSSGAESTGG
jgi:hypothetical protein